MLRTDGDAKAKKCQYESIFMQLADENRYAEVAIKFRCGRHSVGANKIAAENYRGDEQYA